MIIVSMTFFFFQTKELQVWIRKDRYWLNCKKNFWSPNFLLTGSNLKKLFSFKHRQFFFLMKKARYF